MEVCNVIMDEAMPAAYAGEIKQLSKQYLSDHIAVKAEEPRHAIDIVAVSTVVGAAFTALMLIDVAMRRYQEYKVDNTWSIERLKSAVAEELAKVGIIHTEIIGITGYEYLSEKLAGVCSVKVKDNKTGQVFTIYVTPDGATYRLTVE